MWRRKPSAKRFGERDIVKNLSLRLLRGDRLALVGPNGAGKTTLINLLTGELAPDSGTVRLGTNLQMATLDQRRAALDPEATLADTLTGGGSEWVEINGERKHVIGYMQDFLFPPEQARTPTGKLSGGERARLLLARALSQPSNFLVLDEPTNDLDLETLDLLQEMLGDYPGTILLVSHDRDFLDRVAGSVLVSEGEGRWIEYAGGYTDMLSQRGFGLSPTVKAKPAEKKQEKTEPAPRPDARRKLSFKEKHALETLPGQIEKLRATAQKLHAILDDHELYARDPKRFNDASALLAKCRRGAGRRRGPVAGAGNPARRNQRLIPGWRGATCLNCLSSLRLSSAGGRADFIANNALPTWRLRRRLSKCLNHSLSKICGASHERQFRRHRLSQPRLRHVAHRPGSGPQRRHRAACRGLSEDHRRAARCWKISSPAPGSRSATSCARGGTPYAELGLDKATDDAIYAAIAKHPVLIERPLVVSPKGVRLCRPAELVLDLLPSQRGEVLPGKWRAHGGRKRPPGGLRVSHSRKQQLRRIT